MAFTVLIVDDDALARRVIELHFGREPRLKDLGARVLHAADGKKALEMIAAERPDLVIADLLMPRMDGFSFCRELRRAPGGADVPLVIVSGVYRDPAMVGKLIDEVGGRFLIKPVAGRDLAEAVSAVTGGRIDVIDGEGGGRASAEFDVPVGPPTPERADAGATRADPAAVLALASGAGRRSLVMPAVAASAAVVDAHATRADPAASAQLAAQLAATQQGSLADKGLPRLLFDLLEEAATGTLVLRRGRMRKEIFLSEGQPVAADSNLRQEAFGAFLVDSGTLDEARLHLLLGECRQRRMKMGAVLVDLGWMTEEDVLRALESQTRMRLVTSLRWAEGEWAFIPGRTFAERERFGGIDVARVVLGGLRRTTTIESVTRDLAPHTARRLAATPRAFQFRADFQSIYLVDPVPLLDAEPTVGALLERADAEMVVQAVGALLATGMAELGEATTEEVSTAPDAAVALAEPFSLRRLRTSAAAGMPAATAGEAPTGSAPGATDDATADAAAAVLPVKHRELLREYLQIHGRSYYDLLGVPPTGDVAMLRRAYERKAARYSDEAMAGIDLGRDAAKLTEVREILARAFEVLSSPEGRRAHDEELLRRASPGAAFDAELAFRHGRSLLDSGRPSDSVELFAQSTEARPDQAAYQAHLGWASFLAGDAAAARGPLAAALELDPDCVDAHEFLGRIAAKAGDVAAATQHLDRTLVLDAARGDAFDALAAIHAASGDTYELERLYRRVLYRLGEREAELRQRLWRELGNLYAQTLGDRASANIAYEAAARLGPDDAFVQRMVSEIRADDPARWRESARLLAAEWRAKPADTQPALSLIDLLLAAGREDAAALTACALALRGLASPEVAPLIERHRPAALPRFARVLEPAIWARLRHHGEDDDLEALVGVLAAEGLLPPFDPAALDLGPDTVVGPEQAPAAFAGVSRYVATLLGVEVPVLHERADLDGDVRIADTAPMLLVAGPALLASADRLEIGFRLGRALSFGGAGRLAGASRPAAQLAPTVAAALALAGRAGGGDDEAHRLVEALDLEAMERVRAAASRCAARASVDVAAWQRALGATAARVGLLLCGDLMRVGEAVADEDGPEAADELIEFALSPEYVDLCAELITPPG